MAWIESHQELARHPKTKKLARLLGVSLPAAVGHLHFFWWWALDYAQDGCLDRYEHEDIADACGWDGDANTLIQAMVNSEFVEVTEGALTIHDWNDYAGRLIEKRAQNKVRKQKSRGRHEVVTRDTQEIEGDDREGHRATEQNLTVPNHTEPKRLKNSADTSVSKAPRFTPPSREEVAAYCHERLKGVDPEKWYDHYTSNGWKVGKNPMKDWKAAVRTWEKGRDNNAKSRASPERGRGEFDYLSL